MTGTSYSYCGGWQWDRPACGIICSGVQCVSQSEVDRVPVLVPCRVAEPAAHTNVKYDGLY
jgi:hypothetical protein